MWPWFYWWMWPMPHTKPSKPNCEGGHERVQAATEQLEEAQRQKQNTDREARHTGNNLRMLLAGVLRRLERDSEPGRR